MKILHCIPNMAGGGAERQLVYLCEGLHARGHQVEVALTGEGPNFYQLNELGIVTHVIRSRSSYSPGIFRKLRKVVQMLCPDVIQTWLLQMDIVGGWVARMSHIPWILSERSSSLAYGGGLKFALRGFSGRRSTGVAANSVQGARYWTHDLGYSGQTWIIRNGLPLDRITGSQIPTELVRSIGIQSDEPFLLIVSRLSPGKNLDIFLQALAQIRQVVNIKAVLCGEGELQGWLTEMAHHLGLAESVLFLGFRNDVWGWMKRAAAFVSISGFEGSPNAVYEAMACGCPVILSDIAAHREFAGDDTAQFVHSLTAEAVATAILATLRNPALTLTRVEKARALAAQLSVTVMVEQYISLYRALLPSS